MGDQRIKVREPRRVVVEADGYAVPYARAYQQYDTIPYIIFIRSDGWTLGAPKVFQDVAFDLWKNEWVGYAIVGRDTQYIPIADYTDKRTL